jgi:hypothetical protein
MKNKITLTLSGVKLELPIKCLKTNDWSGNKLEKPHIRIGQVESASLIKQFVKQKFPNIVVASASDSYSGGCSCRVYLSDKYGNPVNETITKVVNDFAKQFQEGRFNGMIDCYEYNDTILVSDNGTTIDGGCSYVFVENRPKFGSAPDIIRCIREHIAGNYVCGVQTLEGAKHQIKGYYKELDITKALIGVNLTEALNTNI